MSYFSINQPHMEAEKLSESNEGMTQNNDSVNDNEMYEQDFEPLVENAKTFMKGGCSLFKSVADFAINKEEDKDFSDYITKNLKKICKESDKEFRGKNTFKCLLTLICFKAGFPIFENRFSQLRMTYHHAYEKYKKLSEEQREEVSSVQKLADDYRKENPPTSQGSHDEESSFKKKVEKYIQSHKAQLSDLAFKLEVEVEVDGDFYELKIVQKQK